MMMETAIPFGGFYESIHSRRLGDLLLTQYGCDNPEHDKDSCSDDTCTSKATDEEYRAAQQDYCREYVKLFSREIGIPLEFVEMTSPREYNFETNKIFAKISEADVEKLKGMVDHEEMKDYVKRHFTSCDGFASFYDNDYDKWGVDVEIHERDEDGKPSDVTIKDKQFDHNQIGALIACYVECKGDHSWEWELAERIEI